MTEGDESVEHEGYKSCIVCRRRNRPMQQRGAPPQGTSTESGGAQLYTMIFVCSYSKTYLKISAMG